MKSSILILETIILYKLKNIVFLVILYTLQKFLYKYKIDVYSCKQ